MRPPAASCSCFRYSATAIVRPCVALVSSEARNFMGAVCAKAPGAAPEAAAKRATSRARDHAFITNLPFHLVGGALTLGLSFFGMDVSPRAVGSSRSLAVSFERAGEKRVQRGAARSRA